MAIQLDSGRDSILGGASEARIFLSASVLALAPSSDSGGVGTDGVLIGTTGACCMVAALMRSTAMRSMTAMPTFMGTTEGGRLSRAAVPALVVLALQEEAVRARAPVPLADSATAETRGVFPREDSPASVEACMAVAEVDTEKQALTLGLTWAGPRGKE